MTPDMGDIDHVLTVIESDRRILIVSLFSIRYL